MKRAFALIIFFILFTSQSFSLVKADDPANSSIVTPTPSTEPGAEPAPSPTPSAEPAPSPTPSAEPEPSPIPSAEPSPIPSAEPSPIPSAEPSPTPSAEPASTPNPDPNTAPTEDEMAVEDDINKTIQENNNNSSPEVSPSPEESPSPSPEPSSSSQPDPNASPEPSSNPSPEPSPSESMTEDVLQNKQIIETIDKIANKVKSDDLAESTSDAEHVIIEKIQKDIKNGKSSDVKNQILTDLELKHKDYLLAEADLMKELQKKPHSDMTYTLLSKVYEAEGDIIDFKVFVDGNIVNFDIQPFIQGGRTMVPIRTMAESLHAKVSWDEDTQTANIQKDSTTIKLSLGNNRITLNGVEKTIDESLQSKNDRIMVPARLLAEFFKREIKYNSDSHMIIIR